MPHPTIPLPTPDTASFPCVCSWKLSQKSWQCSCSSHLPPHLTSHSLQLGCLHCSTETTAPWPRVASVLLNWIVLEPHLIQRQKRSHWSWSPVGHHMLLGFLLLDACCSLLLGWVPSPGFSVVLGPLPYMHPLPACSHPAGSFTSYVLVMLTFHPQAWPSDLSI